MTRPRLEGAATIIGVADAAASSRFYVDVLGFELRAGGGPDYALLARDEAAVILTGGADAEALRATSRNVSVYVWAADLDALWAELEPRLAALPEGRVRPPFNQDYGMREFHVKDDDGALIFFGEEVAEA
ncbi:MAG: VOC family protein [Pseudomonadota bacterium]